MIKIEIQNGSDLSKKVIDIFDKAKQKEFKSSPIIIFSKYHKDIFFILKSNNKIASFGHLKKIKINYLNKTYNIFGMANLISVQKNKGYGGKLVVSMIEYAKKKNKTIVAFCEKHNKKFYEKYDIKLNKPLLKRFSYKRHNSILVTW